LRRLRRRLPIQENARKGLRALPLVFFADGEKLGGGEASVAIFDLGADGLDLLRLQGDSNAAEAFADVGGDGGDGLGFFCFAAGQTITDREHGSGAVLFAGHFKRASEAFGDDANDAARARVLDPFGTDKRRTAVGGIADAVFHVAHGALLAEERFALDEQSVVGTFRPHLVDLFY